MSDWRENLFIKRADLSVKIINQRWPITEKLVDAVTNKLEEYGIKGGYALDLCCGNGRISIYLAKKGFRVVGVDFSQDFLEDARKQAEAYGVSDRCSFVKGDVRSLASVLEGYEKGFDFVVNAWTSIGYTSIPDDESIFRQARGMSKDSAVLMILDTMHVGRILNPVPRNIFVDLGDTIMLEQGKFDPLASRQITHWNFYQKKGRDLAFIDELDYNIHVYSSSELTTLLAKAGWKVEEIMGNLINGTHFSSATGMNLIAKAIQVP